jgi:hypothetical protein
MMGREVGGATSATLVQWMAPAFAQYAGRNYLKGKFGAFELPILILLCADRGIK